MYLYERRKQDEIFNQLKQGIDPQEYDIKQKIEDKENQSYVAMMTSISHTYGNVLAYVQNWVMGLFPENLFKTVHVNSKIAHRQIRSTSHEMLKKSKPMIIFRPRIMGPDENVFLQNTMLIERMNDIYSTSDTGAYQPFFHDPKNNFSINYQMNRKVMYVDVICIFATLMQQIDYFNYFINSVRIGHPFFMDTYLENLIPQDMLDIMSKLSGIPMYDDTGSIKPFLDYLNANSNGAITYKLRGASGNKEFYRYYPVNIDALINDVDKDDGDRLGQVMDNYQFTFTLRLEFYTTGFYYLFSSHAFDLPLPEPVSGDTSLIPVFTDVILREDLDLAFGWHLYNRASYRLETANDVVNIDEMLNDAIREVVKYHLQTGIPLSEYVDLKIRRQGKRIIEGIDYTMNWETKDITFISQNTYQTYTIMICVNVLQINELTKSLFGLDNIRS